MDSRTYLNRQLSTLSRARLLSTFCFVIAGLLIVASFVLPALQKAAETSAGVTVGHWEYFLLQLPWLVKDKIFLFYVSALVIVWMACMLRALDTIAEIQCVDWHE